MARRTGMPFDNKHPEIHGTFHTEMAWHVAFATCDLRATLRSDLSTIFQRATLQPWTVLEWSFNIQSHH